MFIQTSGHGYQPVLICKWPNIGLLIRWPVSEIDLISFRAVNPCANACVSITSSG